MSSVETTIQTIQDGMKKISDNMKIISTGIGQMKQTSLKDVVKEGQLDKFKLSEDKVDEMNRRNQRI